jgi:predicted RNA-binding protein
MCLSAVYREKIEDSSIAVQEAAFLTAPDPDTVRIKDLFGRETVLNGFYVKEVNLLKNYVLLAKKE